MHIEPTKCPSCGVSETQIRIDSYRAGFEPEVRKATCLQCGHKFDPPPLRERIRHDD